MWLRIDSQSGVPIYRQVADQIAQAVASGLLVEGDRLPSVRDLAVELAVNPGTVVKAYEELERGGVLSQPRGLGTFVAAVPRLTETERRQRLTALAAAARAEAERLGFDPGELCDAIRAVTPEPAGPAGREGADGRRPD